MVFNSLHFFIFFAVVYPLYMMMGHRFQNWLLLAASYFFYGYWDWRFLGLIFLSTVVDFSCALGIARSSSPRRRNWLLWTSVVLNLGVLGLFKYLEFFLTSLHAAFPGLISLDVSRGLDIVLPVGISFYTFQTMSYTIDVYRGKIEPVCSFLDFAVFVSFFPQLVAGPIERASRLLPQIQAPRRVTLGRIATGSFLFYLGFYQKVGVADAVAPFVNPVFQGGAPPNSIMTPFAVLCFAIQIFCDFAGYSNMARGLACVMGFDLMVNFRVPYLATNPSEFWRRWHISLSEWLRDYLYIPLGGNRGGRWRTDRNLMITMLLGGLWHGASWTFVFWGFYHGALLVLHRWVSLVWPNGWAVSSIWGRRFSTVFRTVGFFTLVCVGWVFFRAETMEQALKILWVCISFESVRRTGLGMAARTVFWCLLPLVPILWAQYKEDDPVAILSVAWWTRSVLYFMMYLAIVTYGVVGGKAFIYFQF